MIRFNDTFIIGIDHGYGNLKTANTVTASGVRVHDIEPPFKKELLEFDGKFICIGENHKSFTADKTTDMDNYYLTLYGIAKELSLAGITEASVHLAVGLPLMWYSEQRDRFSEYMLQNENVEFIYNNKKYSVHIEGVSVYPQGYCAVYERLKDMSGVNMIADIGNGTMNIMKVIDHKVITDSCRTEKLGVEKCVIEIRNALMNKFHEDIDESIIKKFLMNTEQELPKDYENVMRYCTEEYCKNILNALYKYDYHSRLMKLYVVGGGAVLLAISFALYIVLPVNGSLVMAVIVNFVLGLIFIYAVRSQYFAIHDDAGIPMSLSGRVSGIASALGYTPDLFMYTLVGSWMDKYGAAGFKMTWAYAAVAAVLCVILSIVLGKVIKKGNGIDASKAL